MESVIPETDDCGTEASMPGQAEQEIGSLERQQKQLESAVARAAEDLAAVKETIRLVIVEIEQGKVERLPELQTLGERAISSQKLLLSGREQLQVVSAKLQQLVQWRDRHEFPKVIAEAQEQAAQFKKHFRAACLALGAHCLTVERATKISNALGGEPHMGHALDLLKQELDAYAKWDAAVPHCGYGSTFKLRPPAPMKPKV